MGKILTAKEAMAIPGARKCSYGEFQRRRMMTGAVKPKFIGEYLDEHGGRTAAVKYAKVIVTSIVGVPSEDAELAWQGPGVYVVCFDDDCEEFDVTDKKELEWVLEQSPAYSEVQFVDESGFDLGHVARRIVRADGEELTEDLMFEYWEGQGWYSISINGSAADPEWLSYDEELEGVILNALCSGVESDNIDIVFLGIRDEPEH